MPKLGFALLGAVALAVAGCSNRAEVFQDQNDGGWFSKPMNVFAKPDWARPTANIKTVELGPKGPIGPDDLVSADGRCALPAEAAQASVPPPAPPAPADRPVGSVAGDLAGAPMPQQAALAPEPPAAPTMPQVMGGIALGMTECQAVQRAGLPANVAISAGEKGERVAMLTYPAGPWPGIYRFSEGRLREIERVAAPPEEKKPVKKKVVAKKAAKKPATVVQ